MKQPNSLELYHHGILGQRWGVRRSAKQFAKSSGSVKLDLQFFAKRANSRKTVKLGIQEYAHVMSKLRSNISKKQKLQTVIHKPIGDYTYTFENHFDDTYRVIGKKKIPQAITGLLERINDEK